MLVLAHSRGLRWVLINERMAWQRKSASMGRQVAAGDSLFLYAARGAIPHLRGTIIGRAVAVEDFKPIEPPERLGGSDLTHGFRLRLVGLVPPQMTVPFRELVPYIPEFEYERNPRSWTGHLQRGVIQLSGPSVRRISKTLSWSDSVSDVRALFLALMDDSRPLQRHPCCASSSESNKYFRKSRHRRFASDALAASGPNGFLPPFFCPSGATRISREMAEEVGVGDESRDAEATARTLAGMLSTASTSGGPLVVRFPEPLSHEAQELLHSLGAVVEIDPFAPPPSAVKASGRSGVTRRSQSDESRRRMRESYYARPDKQVYAIRRRAADEGHS